MPLKCSILGLLLALFAHVNEAAAQSVRVFEWHPGESSIALLLIHGLGGCAVPKGDSAQSFCGGGASDSFRNTHSGMKWPDLIAQDDYVLSSARGSNKALRIRDLGVWGVDYSRLTTAPCPRLNIPELSSIVRDAIEQSGIFEKYEQIIFLAHSMGGLVAKHVMLGWQGTGDPKGLLPRVIGLLFLGVPSQGSPVAPKSDVIQYLLEVTKIDYIAGMCKRQVKDLVAGDENTFLFELEQRWEELLGARRRHARGIQTPLISCAYETQEEPISLFSVTLLEQTIVERSYTHTQCSIAKRPIPTFHTQLPKPNSLIDDVHGFWARKSLEQIIDQWRTWPFHRFDFNTTADTLSEFKRRVNEDQRAFTLEYDDDVASYLPTLGSYDGPNWYMVVMNFVERNNGICAQESWRTKPRPIVRLRQSGRCVN